MAALNLEAPGLTTLVVDEAVQYTPTYDQNTVDLRNQLNEVTYYEPTFPPAFNTWVRTYGPTNDETINVGFHQADVPSGIVQNMYRYESPDVPVTHLAWQESLFNTTLTSMSVGGQVIFNALRSPTPNEGIF